MSYFQFTNLFGLISLFLWINVILVIGSPSNIEPLTSSDQPKSSALASPSSASTTNGSTVENVNCESQNSSCESCVKSRKCFYCYPTSSCLPFSLRLTGCSSVKETAYGTCLVKLNVLAIALGSVAGVILLAVLITCCCCCRCHRKRSDWEVDNQKENLTMRGSVIRDNAFARREERQRKVEEIKRKYGITDKKYNRF